VKVKNVFFDSRAGEWVINLNGQERLTADAVCLALPAYSAGSLLESVDDKLADDLSSIAYASSAIINFAFRREDIAHPLDGFGFVTPFIEKRTVLACSFSSIKYAGRAPTGHVLLRAFLGGAMQPELFNLDDEEMQRRALDDLRDLLCLRAEPLFAQITRWPRSMAQYHVGHREKIARINERLERFPSLALAGNAYSGAGIPDCVRGGFASADKIQTFLNNPL
jgi:oxygen-dependent protoporphyrinogen oxidase